MVNSSNNNNNTGDYYTAGNSELATESRLTVERLEPRRRLTKSSARTVIALVGLPARGKSFVARKLYAYLNWSGVCECKIFNVGQYRRQAYAAATTTNNNDIITERQSLGSCDAQFFNAENRQGQALRQQVAEDAMTDMLDWLNDNGAHNGSNGSTLGEVLHEEDDSSEENNNNKHTARSERVAIFDATNSTQKRREWIINQCRQERSSTVFEKSIEVIFVESICDDQELLHENYRYKVSSSPDFRGIPLEDALSDLKNRVANYQAQYEEVEDDSMSYIKIFNLSTKLMVNHIYGRMAKEVVPALMAWHIGTRPIYLCRSGQTFSGNTTDGEGYVNHGKGKQQQQQQCGNSSQRSLRGDTLGPNGQRFKEELWEFLQEQVKEFVKRRASVRDYSSNNATDGVGTLRIYTSTMPRAVDTVSFCQTQKLEHSVEQLSNLNPLDKGDFAGCRDMEEMQDMNQHWYQRLEQNPYATRFPGGESYRDIMARLHSVIIDVEQEVVPTLVVSHVSILQCLMAYFRCSRVEKCMSIEVPLHTVIKFTPVRGGGWSESHHPFYEIPEGALASPPSPPVVVPENIMMNNMMSEHSNNNTHRHHNARQRPIWGDGMPTSAQLWIRNRSE